MKNFILSIAFSIVVMSSVFGIYKLAVNSSNSCKEKTRTVEEYRFCIGL